MIPFLCLALVCGALAVDHPTPRLKHHGPASLDITLEDTPHYKYVHIDYGTDALMRGPLSKSSDGQWHHHNGNVNFDVGRPVKYTVTAEKHGKLIKFSGVFSPEHAVVIPQERIRRAGVVFRDDFSGAGLNTGAWKHEVSMYGGYNWEIQAYTNDPLNCFTKNGHLYLKPTLTSDKFGEDFLHNGVMDMQKLWGECTNADRNGCHREGRYGILPPVMSCKLTTSQTITYGRVEVRAKIPKGDWIWPAIWLLPKYNHYGAWPRSGEIDIMESRGNTLASSGGHNHGVNEVGATLHWGPSAGENAFSKTHGVLQSNPAWSEDFHTYVLDWTKDHIHIDVDGHRMLTVPTPGGGFYNWGGFGSANPWASGGHSAPFDQPFYLILNVAIGGRNGFFPDDWHYNSPKPWNTNSPTESADFWNKRNDWLSSWVGDHVAMQVDYVEMTQY